MKSNGGYDDGYEACSCFWGCEPGSLIKWMKLHNNIFNNKKALDIGCGEGKNSIYLARQGAIVDAMDISQKALQNAKNIWADYDDVNWRCCDIRLTNIDNKYDIIIGYGLLHCLSTCKEVTETVSKMQIATNDGGYNIICAFNSRYQDLSAHPNFSPILLAHEVYVSLYNEWDILYLSDEDLHEEHPHNKIPHTHSMTRLIARKGSNL
jgi:2-polyprenyl-3-methyl-5-hydroxy-6-metoxy-1,4-benzoquinol methylase